MTEHADTEARVAGFAEDTAVTARGDGRYGAIVTDRWHVLGDAAPNGGYLMAIAARAMADACGRPDPVTLTAHYLRPPAIGPVEVVTEVVKTGRRHATVQASLQQDGRECVRLLGAFGDLTSADGPTRLDRQPPDLPPREMCVDINAEADASPQASFAPPILRRFDTRMPAGSMDWVAGRPTGRGEMSGWCRFAGAEPMDTLGVLVVADAYPPAVFNAGGIVGWVPTIELTVQVRKRPDPDAWLLTRFRTEHVTRGYLEEDGEIWDERGDLVALSRQLALVAQPR